MRAVGRSRPRCRAGWPSSSQGGGDEMENQISACRFHHLRCIHGGYLKVVGRAPDALTWTLNGHPWTGGRG